MGRRAFALAYWVLVVWVVVAAFVSVVRQVFWPAPDGALPDGHASLAPSPHDSSSR